MGNWIIRWNFSKESYSPGETASVSFWLENTGDTYLYVSRLKLEFDFGVYDIPTAGGAIPPRTNAWIATAQLQLPSTVVGRKLFRLGYNIYELIGNDWLDLGFYRSDKQYFLSIYPEPLYTVFVSRGLSIDDRTIGDPIVEKIKAWGFRTVTVGIEVQVPEREVPLKVREEIRRADGLVAIATPRYIDALTGLWRTLEWLHSEVGIAFGVDKPLLLLKDRRVSLGGLPSYLRGVSYPIIEFDPSALDQLDASLSSVMPEFRNWIETKRRQEFFEAIKGGLAFVGAVVIVAGIIGSILGGSKR